MNINHNVALNLSASVTPPTLHMAQGDANSRTIVATLWDGAQIFEIPSGSTCMVRFGKPDGTGGLYDHTEAGEAVSYLGSVVTAPVATQMLTAAGIVKAQIDIYGGGGTDQEAIKLASFVFLVDVHPSAYADDAILSSDYYNIIAAQIAAAIEAGKKVDAAIAATETATTAAETATNAKTDAENAKAAAESAKSAAESAKTSAESAKTTAVNSANTATNAKTAAENAKRSAENSASSSETSAQNAARDAEDAEAWAVGQRNGVNVPSTDPAYQNNAKYYKDLAQAASGGGVLSVNGKTPNDSGTVTLVASDINTSSGGSVETALSNKAGKSTGVSVTLSASYWDADAKTQTVSVAGVTATANGSMRIAQSATDEQFTAWGAAQPRVTAQADGSITVKLAGTVPTIDIPVEVLIV